MSEIVQINTGTKTRTENFSDDELDRAVVDEYVKQSAPGSAVKSTPEKMIPVRQPRFTQQQENSI